MATNNYLTQHLWEWNVIINCKIRMLQETRIVFFLEKELTCVVWCAAMYVFTVIYSMCVNCSDLLHYIRWSVYSAISL